MSLRYGLVPFLLNKSKNKYKALPTDNESINEEDIIEEMIAKGSTVSKAEALAVIEEYEAAICKAIEEGKNINTRMYKIHAAIKGVFESEKDIFDPQQHSIQINIKAGKRLKQCVENIQLNKVILNDNAPVILSIKNLHTNKPSHQFSGNQAISIIGKKLKFDLNDPRQGIFFVNEDGTEFRVDNLIKIKPSELIFIVPDPIIGNKFFLEVRCLFPNSNQLRLGKYSEYLLLNNT